MKTHEEINDEIEWNRAFIFPGSPFEEFFKGVVAGLELALEDNDHK